MKKGGEPSELRSHRPADVGAEGFATVRSFTVRGSESLGSKASVVRASREAAEPFDEIVESGRSPLDSIVRDRARRMLQAALESEVDAFLDEHAVLLARYDECSRRDLTGKQYVSIWVDGIHVRIRLEDLANPEPCLLVVMGATADGQKELIAVIDGVRESKQSWLELLLDLKNRGLTIPPTIAVADGALGFWAALREAYPTTREQRCSSPQDRQRHQLTLVIQGRIFTDGVLQNAA